MEERKISTDDWDIIRNWLRLNQRMAEQQKQQQRREQDEAEKHVRVHDLRKIWNQF